MILIEIIQNAGDIRCLQGQDVDRVGYDDDGPVVIVGLDLSGPTFLISRCKNEYIRYTLHTYEKA